MKRSRKLLVVCLAALFLVAIVAACASDPDPEPVAAPTPAPADTATEPAQAEPEPEPEPAPADLEPILVGGAFAFTTPVNMTDQFAIEGFLMAVEEINAAGGIAGRQIEYFTEDTGDDPTTAVNAYNRLIDQHGVSFIIGPSFTNQHLAVEPIVRENEILVFGMSTNIRLIQDYEWYIRVRPSDGIACSAAALFAIDEMGATRIGITHTNNDFGNGGRDILIDVLATRGLEPVAVETFDPDDRDLSPMLLSMRDADAEVIIHWGHAADSAVAQTQNVQLGINLPMIVSPGAVAVTSIEMADGATDGNFGIVDVLLDARTDERSLQWIADYNARWGRDPGVPQSMAAYDAVYLLKAAIEAAGGSLNTTEVRDAVLGITMQGVSGYFQFPEPIGEALWSVDIIQFDYMTPVFVRTVAVG